MRVRIVTVEPLAEAWGAKVVAARAHGYSVKQEFVTNLTSEHVLKGNLWIAQMRKHTSIDLT